MRVMIDPTLCTACGLCADECPEVFELGEEYAEVLVEVVPEDLEDCILDAEASCPVEAISHK